MGKAGNTVKKAVKQADRKSAPAGRMKSTTQKVSKKGSK